jgi:hypothetical protein
VLLLAAGYLGVMLVNVVVPTGLSSPRGYFNLDWITLVVIGAISLAGAIYFLLGRPDRRVARHVHDELELTGAERVRATEGS